jgi:TRAP-type C4-dicarboxylate transport system substrate-binding protein
MQLGGAPPQLYDQARDGVVDIVWTLPGNTPGRFPVSETFELPFVAHRKAIVNSRAFQEFAEAHMKDEFKEVHPICFWAHDHGLVHANKPVRTLDDMKGLKLRSPTRLAGEALRALGASAVGMPIPQVPESLAQRVIDGTVVPWEVVPSIKVHELVKNHTDIPGSPTLYTATFILAMNKAKYEGLPDDLKKVVDANSGQAAATAAGRVWDEQADVVSAMVKARGNTIIVLAEEEKERWRKATEPVIENWLKTVKERGLDGQKLLDAARGAIKKHEAAA